jgi:fused signal recognition particle receptor
VRNRFSRLLSGLAKTRRALTEGIKSALSRGRGLDEVALDSIEETLIAADLGVETATHLVDTLREEGASVSAGGDERVREVLAREIETMLTGTEKEEQPAHHQGDRPLVIMVAGVNGVGKTTTIGKLAHRYVSEGKSVIIAAADTFRAAAVDQLFIWAERSGAQFVGGQMGGDAAAVAFDALGAATARGTDVLIVDTAGRLHTQKNLMQELTKIKRVLGREKPGAPQEILLVVDANTGQNALSQARLFDGALGLTGLVLSKMDGTARGGIVVAIARELALPVLFIGTGEGMEDIEPFEASAFAKGLMGLPEEDAETERTASGRP